MGQDSGLQAPRGGGSFPREPASRRFSRSRPAPARRPRRSKKSPAPFVHAASHEIRRELYEAYRWFVAAYRTAADKLRTGDRTQPASRRAALRPPCPRGVGTAPSVFHLTPYRPRRRFVAPSVPTAREFTAPAPNSDLTPSRAALPRFELASVPCRTPVL